MQDLEEFVDGSGDHGFIVFTLGSFVSELPEFKAREFFEAFRQIPQRVRRKSILYVIVERVITDFKHSSV